MLAEQPKRRERVLTSQAWLRRAVASLCFSRNSSTSREILRRVAAESLKTLAVAANVGHLLLKRILRRAIASRYLAARRRVKRVGQDTALIDRTFSQQVLNPLEPSLRPSQAQVGAADVLVAEQLFAAADERHA